MDSPFGHHHHHHQRRDDDENEDRRSRNQVGYHPPPGVHNVSHERGYETPPTNAGGSAHLVSHDRGYEFPPPFSGNPVHHVSHDYMPGYAPPPPSFGAGAAPPFFLGAGAAPPPYLGASAAPPPFDGAPVRHDAHESQYGGGGMGYGWDKERHHHRPGYSEAVGHESLEGGAMNRQPTVRIFTKAEENYSLSIRDGKVILARKDPSDDRQHWIKDLKYSTKIKDAEGFPGFALVNKATGEALKHSFGATHPVQLIPYNPNYPDESVLWSESKDLGDGFRCVRMVNNIRLNFDAFNGDENHGGVHDGTILVLWEWLKGNNQRWKVIPYCKSSLYLFIKASQSCRYFFFAATEFSLQHFSLVIFGCRRSLK